MRDAVGFPGYIGRNVDMMTRRFTVYRLLFWLVVSCSMTLLGILLSCQTVSAAALYTVYPQQTCPPTTCVQERVYGYQPARYTTLRPVFFAAASNSLGEDGPTYKLINRGLPPNTYQETVSVLRPIPHPLLRAITWQESQWLQFADSVGDADNQYACTFLSYDCGYGLTQVTSCMTDGCGWFSPTLVSGVYTYNLGTGANILIEKWNAQAFAGDNDHTLIEEWYYATTAYNGWSQCNDPNRDVFLEHCPVGIRDPFDPQRSPYGARDYTNYAYPYQEIIWGLMAHPELITISSHWLWRPTYIPTVPNGIFGLRGTGDWQPPTQTVRSITHILPNLYVRNGSGSSLHLQNPTSDTLATEIWLFDTDHTFNRKWLYPSSTPIRLAPGSSHLLFLSEVFTPTAVFSGYVRVHVSSGVTVTALSPPPAHKLYLPLVLNNYTHQTLTCYEQIYDGGFEATQNGKPLVWAVSSTDKYTLVDSTWFRSGHRGAYLGGYDYAEDSLAQSLSIPADATVANLTYSWYMRSKEVLPTDYDFLYVRLRELLSDDVIATLTTVTNQDVRNVWHTTSIDLSGYKNRNMRIFFEADTDLSKPTSFFIDDVRVQVCVP